MSEQSKEEKHFIGVGQRVGDILCSSYRVFGDIVVVWENVDKYGVFSHADIRDKKMEKYTIGGQEVDEVYLPKNHRILILKTGDQSHIRDYQNLPISDAENWQDYYSDPISGDFFRQDSRGTWHDIEGNKMESPIFLQDEILLSLPGKSSKKSLVYRGQNLTISPCGSMIQVGKLVYDLQLQLVPYYGEKITSIGSRHIVFQQEEEGVQEVHLGLNQSAYLYTSTLKPYLIDQEPITNHLLSVRKGGKSYEVFRSNENEFVVVGASQEVLSCDGHKVRLDFDTYLKLGDRELVKCYYGDQAHFMDIQARSTFYLPEISEKPIIDIAPESIMINGERVRNVATEKKKFVYNEAQKKVFTLNDGKLIPQAIHASDSLSKFFATADLGEEEILFNKKTRQTLSFPEEELHIQKIEGKAYHKLLNAESSSGEKIVLDARHGMDQLKPAFSGRQALVEVFGQSKTLGSAVLQNALLKTLGGSHKRVIDLNKEDLAIFLLPDDLTTFPQDIHPSVYLENPVIELDLENPIAIEEEIFFQGLFLPYYETPTSIIIQQKNKRPLHLEGAGHRNELVTSFLPKTLSNNYPLGFHRMIGAHTLSEDGKEAQLLFSIKKQKSWLSFNDDFLPILEKVAYFDNTSDWEYLLYKLRESEGRSNYLVVEKGAPHRILIAKRKGKELPKFVEFTEDLEEPEEELSFIQRVFGNKKGFLKEMRR